MIKVRHEGLSWNVGNLVFWGLVVWVSWGTACGGDDDSSNTNQLQNNNQSAVCGNGILEIGELCDDGALNSDSVVDACRTDCRRPYCGDGVVDTGEQCDLTLLNEQQCSDLGFTGGTLSCSENCAFDLRSCSLCGNGILEEDEECDGLDVGGQDCSDVSGFDDGVLKCTSACTFDQSDCNSCGNQIAEGLEQCDASDMGGTECTDLGFSGGVLDCSVYCLYDTTPCYDCGDGLIESPEVCDGNVLGYADCASETVHSQGELSCQNDCLAFDTTGCHTCNNGQLEGPEWCDTGELGTATCQSLGFSGGNLHCGFNCFSYETSDCYTCGDGVCDTVNGEDRHNCADDCRWVDIVAGYYHSCGIKADGSAWCWGDNSFGQLGDLTYVDSFVPVKIVGPTGITAIGTGEDHTCVIDGNTEVWCWGANDYGQLGSGFTAAYNITPKKVLSTYGSVVLSVGYYQTCVAMSNGVAQCWGRNNDGAIGNDTTNHQFVPTQVLPSLNPDGDMLGVLAISTGSWHTCALNFEADYGGDAPPYATAWCWGRDNYEQLGNGAADGEMHYPDKVLPTPQKRYISISASPSDASYEHSCAVIYKDATEKGEAFCWGAGNLGQLGLGNTVEQPQRPATPILNNVKTVSAGGVFTCALRNDGTVWCWGKNNYHQLGTGINHDICPVTQCSKVPVQTAVISSAIAVSSGAMSACAVTSDGAAYCWGYNGTGQLGDGTDVNKFVPTLVVGP